jgi:hypothetical protein
VRRSSSIVVLVAGLAAALAPGSSAQTPGPCPDGSPTLVLTVNGRAEPVYTTHDLLVRAKLSGGAYFSVVSFDVTGVRRLPHPDGDEGSQSEIHAIADSPGTLTATATLTDDSSEETCTVSGSRSFEIRQATAPLVSKLRRPAPFKQRPGWTWDQPFRFKVAPGPTGARTPITVEARAIRKARVPGPGVPAARRTFAMRPSDATDAPEPEPRRGCSEIELICPRTVNTWPTGAEVDVRASGGRVVPTTIRVFVNLPRGYPRGLRLIKTPIGVDVKVRQDGAVIARLRIAGRCDPRGQFSLCRYRKLTTAR